MTASTITNRIGDACRDNLRLFVLLVILACELLWVAAPAIVEVIS